MTFGIIHAQNKTNSYKIFYINTILSSISHTVLKVHLTEQILAHSPVQVAHYVFQRARVARWEIFQQLSEFLHQVEDLGVGLLSLIQHLGALGTVSSVWALRVQALLRQPH